MKQTHLLSTVKHFKCKTKNSIDEVNTNINLAYRAVSKLEAQQQMANFKRWKAHGRKENAFPSLLFDQGAPPFHFALSCANSVYAVELPA